MDIDKTWEAYEELSLEKDLKRIFNIIGDKGKFELQ